MRKRARPYSVRWFRAKPLLRICLREIVILEHPPVTQRLKAFPLVLTDDRVNERIPISYRGVGTLIIQF